ncbi:hypothetical protein IPM65_02460 [Candidatus Roizmanbacteria bacterium]|nr:MAG: hypothetical protein IPM65_02460 [Candidatus Roizmanbacteria bacterium]
MDEKDIRIPEKLQITMNDYKKHVTDAIYLNTDKFIEDINIGVKDFAKYILREGTPKAKHDFIKYLPISRRLRNKTLI